MRGAARGRGGAGGHWQAARPPLPRFKGTLTAGLHGRVRCYLTLSYTHARRAAAAELRARRTDDARSQNILVPHSGPALSIYLKRFETPFAAYYEVAFSRD